MRVVVVGASSGLGRCIAVGLGRRGVDVALLARRSERLETAAAEIGSRATTFACDVTDEASCKSTIARVADEMGGIDALVYCPGIGPLKRLVDVDAVIWAHVFNTNVTGAALITAAAVKHLEAANGAAAYLSSVSASMTPPWPGLGAYAVSKAALDKLVEAWRAEHPRVNFTRVIVGDCAGGDGDGRSEFASGWDLALAGELFPIWVARGYVAGALMDVEDLVETVDSVLRTRASVPSITVTPRRPA